MQYQGLCMLGQAHVHRANEERVQKEAKEAADNLAQERKRTEQYEQERLEQQRRNSAWQFAPYGCSTPYG